MGAICCDSEPGLASRLDARRLEIAVAGGLGAEFLHAVAVAAAPRTPTWRRRVAEAMADIIVESAYLRLKRSRRLVPPLPSAGH